MVFQKIINSLLVKFSKFDHYVKTINKYENFNLYIWSNIRKEFKRLINYKRKIIDYKYNY